MEKNYSLFTPQSHGVSENIAPLILNHGARRSECSASRSACCAPRETGPRYPINMILDGRQNRYVSFGIKAISADGNHTTILLSNDT